MQRGYAGISGSPVRPYVQFSTNVGSTVYLDLTFLDRKKQLATPTALTYRIDDITTDNVVLADTIVAPTGPLMTLVIPASINYIQNDLGQSSQLNQVTVTAGYSDGSFVQTVHIYELIAIQTIGGATSPDLA